MDLSKIKEMFLPNGKHIKMLKLNGKKIWEWITNKFLRSVSGNSVQSNLPDGYTQLEYDKNTAAVIIDTGIVPTDDTVLYVRYSQTGTISSNYIFASRETATSGIYGIAGSGTGSHIAAQYGSGGAQSAITRVQDHIYDVTATFKNGNITLDVIDETDGTSDTQTTSYGTFVATETTFKYFGFNAGNCISAGTCVYEVEIIQSGVSVYHAYPCKQTSDNAIGFYDIVGGTFADSDRLSAGLTAPTPDAPIEIKSVGNYDATTGKYKVPVKVSGKNLFDMKYSVGYAGSAPNVTETPNGKSTEWYKVSDVVDSEGKVTVVVNPKEASSACVFGTVYSNDKETIARRFGMTNTSQFTLNEDKVYKTQSLDSSYTYVKFYVISWSSINYLGVFTDPNTTAYTEYKDPVTYTAILSEPLRKVGGYADKLTRADDGSFSVERAVGKHICSASDGWAQYSSSYWWLYRLDNVIIGQNGSSCPSYCSHLVYDRGDMTSATYGQRFKSSDRSNTFYLANKDCATKEELDTWITANKVEIVYALYEPTTDTNVSWADGEPLVYDGDTVEFLTEVQPSAYTVE